MLTTEQMWDLEYTREHIFKFLNLYFILPVITYTSWLIVLTTP